MNSIFETENIVIFDMEVIDFKLDHKVLVQFSARKYKGNKLIDTLNIIVNNHITLPKSFKRRTRISQKLVKNKGISLSEALDKIHLFILNYTLVTYKGNFFYLQMLWFLFDNKLRNSTIDVADVAKEFGLISNPDDINIQDLCLSLSIDFNENKICNAYYDVILIEKIWFKLKSLLKQRK